MWHPQTVVPQKKIKKSGKMSISPVSTASRRRKFKQSRCSSSASGTWSSDSGSVSGSQISLPNSTCSFETEGDTQWRSVLTAKLFVQPLENRFLCASCMRVLMYPVSLPHCEHNVCSSCLGDLCRGRRVCPADGKKIIREEALANDKLGNDLNQLELSCSYKEFGCVWVGKLENFKDHYDSCEYLEKSCRNGCNYRGSKRQMNVHIASDCPLRLITCEFCKRHLSAEQEIEHLKNCPRLPVDCPKGCGKREIPREDVQKHLAEECFKADIACPYEQLGCSFKGGRTAIADHVDGCLKQHVSLLCQSLLSHSKLLSGQEVHLKECVTTVSDHTEKLAILMQDTETQLLWKIDEWSSKMAQAISGKKIALHSLPFYTARHQYRLSLSLLPNGDRKAKGYFMSLYVRICRGEYDSLLSWPFSHGMDLILVDQSQDPRARSDFVYTLRPNPCKENLPFLGRPTSEANPSFGPQNFISHTVLNSRDYVRDDIIFIRVCVKREKKL